MTIDEPNQIFPTRIEPKRQRHVGNAVSPFRYPGGKGFLSGYLAEILALRNVGSPTHFVEPFCGGAGAALNLLADGVVEFLHLNDADVRIYSAWKAMLDEGPRFSQALSQCTLDMSEWHTHSTLVAGPAPAGYSFELGFATFYMNRTTRSGIVSGAGPIGGYNQDGKWKIDARFNKERLINQISWIGENRGRIELSNLDGLRFLSQSKRTLPLEKTLYFIDPPYVKAGDRLYLNGMTEAKHIALSDMLSDGTIPHWILTYDDAPLIRSIYRNARQDLLSVNYSLQNKRKEAELLLLPGS